MSDAVATRSTAEPGLNGSWVELEMNSSSSAAVAAVAAEPQAAAPSPPGLSQVVEEDDGIAGGLEHVPSSSSIHNGDMEKILLDAQHESSRSNSSCDSPPRPHSPQDEGQIIFDVDRGENQSIRLVQDMYERSMTLVRCAVGQTEEFNVEVGLHQGSALSPSEFDMVTDRVTDEEALEKLRDDEILMKDSDWVADWSSRPENVPPKEFQFRHPRRAVTLSMRKTRAMKKGGIFSAEFLRVFLPSLLLSHLLVLGLGVYIGKRLTAPPASSF